MHLVLVFLLLNVGVPFKMVRKKQLTPKRYIAPSSEETATKKQLMPTKKHKGPLSQENVWGKQLTPSEKHNGPPLQGRNRIRLSWTKQQIRSGNTELARAALAERNAGQGQSEPNQEQVHPMEEPKDAEKGSSLPSENAD